MAQRIKVLEMGAVAEGMRITEPDSDYPYGTLVPETDYLADEQDWHRVVQRRGYVDLPTFLLEMYNGERYEAKYQSSADVWVLVDETGLPYMGE